MTIRPGFHPNEKLSLSHENDIDIRYGSATGVCNANGERRVLGSLIPKQVDSKRSYQCKREQCELTRPSTNSREFDRFSPPP